MRTKGQGLGRPRNTPPRSNTRERLVQTMLDLMWSASYGAVSVDDICKQADAQKGSFYHFFSSKAELAVVAFETQWEEWRGELDAIFSASRPPLERFSHFLKVLEDEQKKSAKEFGYVVGCPFCSVGSELATQDETIRARIKVIFENHLRYFENALRDAVAEGALPKKLDVKAKAREIDAFINGAMINARIRNSLEPVGRDLVKGVFGCLDVPTPAKKAA